MAPEIPSQFNFETLLSHTFPGFFLALGVFMLLDLLSPKELTSWACGTIGDFLMVIGFIIIVGTILGILIDGIQHALEKGIFENCQEFKDLDAERDSLYPSSNIKHFYYFTRNKAAFTHLTDNYYRYAEFYGNIAISLIAISIIAPFYFRDILDIAPRLSFFWGCLVPLVLAGFCIYSSYETFIKYHRFRIDLIYGILRVNKSIQFTKKEISTTVKPVKITAQLKEWTLAGLEQEDLEKIKECVKNDCKLNDRTLSEHLGKYKVWKASDVRESGVEITFKAIEGLLLKEEPLFKEEPYLFSFTEIANDVEQQGKLVEYLQQTKNNRLSQLIENANYVPSFCGGQINITKNRVRIATLVIKNDLCYLKHGYRDIELGKVRHERNKRNIYKETKGEETMQLKTENGKAPVWFESDKPGTFSVTASSEGFISGKVVVTVEKPNKDKKEGKKKENVL